MIPHLTGVCAPSCAEWLFPQQYTRPTPSSAQTWSSPTATDFHAFGWACAMAGRAARCERSTSSEQKRRDGSRLDIVPPEGCEGGSIEAGCLPARGAACSERMMD